MLARVDAPVDVAGVVGRNMVVVETMVSVGKKVLEEMVDTGTMCQRVKKQRA